MSPQTVIYHKAFTSKITMFQSISFDLELVEELIKESS